MVRYIVCFKPKDREEAKETLLSMRGKTEDAPNIEVGTDFPGFDRSDGVVPVADFADRAVRERYRNDPYHAGVVKTYMRAARKKRVSVDYGF